MSVTVDQMRSKLLTLDAAREQIAATEPLSTYGFSVGENVRFRLQPGWNHGADGLAGSDRVEASVSVGNQEFPLTKDALLRATSFAGLRKSFALQKPSHLTEPVLNWWFREGSSNHDFKLLVAGENAAAFTKSTVVPFSNLNLLDETLAGIEAKYGVGEVLVDYKFTHSLARTAMRLIIPEERRVITGTGTEDDTWSVGIQLRNSLIGEGPTELSGYLFRWWCTNGSVDTLASSGAWSRRGPGSPEDVYAWARSAVDSVLGGLEPALDHVQSLVDIPVSTDANVILRDMFEHYHVPAGLRTSVIENMAETDQLNMYGVMQAVTEAANASGLDPKQVEQLLRIGGDLPHSSVDRCGTCRRLN